MRNRLVGFVLLIAVLAPNVNACDRCVIGGDGLAWCRPANVYSEQWPLIANCEPITRCHRFPNSQACYPDCDGDWCYSV